MVACGRSAGQIAKLHFFTPHAWIARFNANCLHESIIQARVTCPFSYCGSLHFNDVERPFVHELSAQETVPNSDQFDRSVETWRNSTQSGGVVYGEGNFREMKESWKKNDWRLCAPQDLRPPPECEQLFLEVRIQFIELPDAMKDGICDATHVGSSTQPRFERAATQPYAVFLAPATAHVFVLLAPSPHCMCAMPISRVCGLTWGTHPHID